MPLPFNAFGQSANHNFLMSGFRARQGDVPDVFVPPVPCVFQSLQLTVRYPFKQRFAWGALCTVYNRSVSVQRLFSDGTFMAQRTITCVPCGQRTIVDVTAPNQVFDIGTFIQTPQDIASRTQSHAEFNSPTNPNGRTMVVDLTDPVDLTSELNQARSRLLSLKFEDIFFVGGVQKNGAVNYQICDDAAQGAATILGLGSLRNISSTPCASNDINFGLPFVARNDILAATTSPFETAIITCARFRFTATRAYTTAFYPLQCADLTNGVFGPAQDFIVTPAGPLSYHILEAPTANGQRRFTSASPLG